MIICPRPINIVDIPVTQAEPSIQPYALKVVELPSHHVHQHRDVCALSFVDTIYKHSYARLVAIGVSVEMGREPNVVISLVLLEVSHCEHHSNWLVDIPMM